MIHRIRCAISVSISVSLRLLSGTLPAFVHGHPFPSIIRGSSVASSSEDADVSVPNQRVVVLETYSLILACLVAPP